MAHSVRIREPAQRNDRRAVAAALGRLHATKINISARPGHARIGDLPIPPVREMPPNFEAWLPTIHQARADMIKLISQLNQTRQLTVGVTHNDISRECPCPRRRGHGPS